MKIAVAATLLATASAFSISPQQVRMTVAVSIRIIDCRMTGGYEVLVPIGVNTNALGLERVERVHYVVDTHPYIRRSRVVEFRWFPSMAT